MADAEKLVCDALNSVAALCVNPTSPRDDLAAAFPQLENPADREELAAAMEILRDAARAAICLRKQRDALLEACKSVLLFGIPCRRNCQAESVSAHLPCKCGAGRVDDEVRAAIAMTEDKSHAE